MGPDDFLAEHGAERLKEIVESAVPADPAKRAQLAAALGVSELVELLGDQAFLASLLEADVPSFAASRIPFQRVKLSADFASAVRNAKQRLREADRERSEGPSFDIQDGALCRADGTRLANFAAKVTEEVTVDDGVEQRKIFVVETTLADGTRLPNVRLSPKEFLLTNWATEQLGAAAQIVPGRGSLDQTSAAVLSVSSPRKTLVHGHSGFKRINGRPQFLLPGAELDAGVVVELPAGLHRYGFPREHHELGAATNSVLGLLQIAPERILLPLLLAALRAPINCVLPADFVLHVYGATGALKSSLVALVASMFGSFTAATLPASFTDTVNSLEFKTNVLGDVVVPVDELVVRSNSSYDEAASKAVSLIRSVGNGAPKGRMQRDLSARPPRPPRGLVICTGEQLPAGQSVLARSLCIQVNPGDVDLRALTLAQREGHVLGSFMREYVGWLGDRLGLVELWAPRRHAELRATFGQHKHLRAGSALANLMMGAELFVEFCQHAGVMTPAAIQAFLSMASDALVAATTRQDETVADANPAKLFLRVLGELLQTRQIYLAGPPQAPPPSSLQVGWKRPDEILLLGDIAFGAVAREVRSRGEAMPTDAATLWRRLRDEGLRITDKDGKDPKRDIAGKRQRVKVLVPHALSDVDLVPPGSVGPYGPPSSAEARGGGNDGESP